VRTLQEFAEVEGGQLGVQREPVSLIGLVEDLRALMAPLLAGRPIEFRGRIRPGAEQLVTDRCLLHRILANLLANAAKFTERGMIELAAERVQGEIVVVVRDTGAGIAAEEIDRIFAPFVRGTAVAVGAPRGMGLGLAIARELTRLCGGRLEVESEVGRGSTFRVWLPAVVPSADPPPARAPSALDLGTARLHAVLLIEDRP
jgi:signal transduction histidine kinase